MKVNSDSDIYSKSIMKRNAVNAMLILRAIYHIDFGATRIIWNTY